MGQEQSTPPPHNPTIDTDFKAIPIPEKYKKEFDDEITDHNEQVLSLYTLANQKCIDKITELKLTDFEEGSNASDGKISELESLFFASSMTKLFHDGNYECLKDWKGMDLFNRKYTALERRKLVNDLRKCGNRTDELQITDQNLATDWERVVEFVQFLDRDGSLKSFRHYAHLLKNTQYGINNELLENGNPEETFTEDDRRKLNQLIPKLNLENSLKKVLAYGDNITSIPPCFYVFASQQTTSYCRRSVLDCLKKNHANMSDEEAVDATSVGDFHTCLFQTPCFSKLGLWLNEIMENEKMKK